MVVVQAAFILATAPSATGLTFPPRLIPVASREHPALRAQRTRTKREVQWLPSAVSDLSVETNWTPPWHRAQLAPGIGGEKPRDHPLDHPRNTHAKPARSPRGGSPRSRERARLPATPKVGSRWGRRAPGSPESGRGHAERLASVVETVTVNLR